LAGQRTRGFGMQLFKKIALTVAVAAAFGAAPSFAQQAGAVSRPARIGNQPNINGIWQAMNNANWNLEAHSAEALKEFWALGSLAAIPAGQSVIDGDGKIPYKPEALALRNENRAGWPKSDPETTCYLPGIPRATYMPFPFQIVQGGGNILFVYTYASANRLVNMGEPIVPPVDTWMGQSNGRWEGTTLVVETTGFNGMTWLDRAGNHHTNALKVTERFTPVSDNHLQYSATLEDANVYSRPWTISMPLYRHIEPNAQILEFKCVPFVEELLYKDLELPAAQ
jgi:hypothetical protein